MSIRHLCYRSSRSRYYSSRSSHLYSCCTFSAASSSFLAVYSMLISLVCSKVQRSSQTTQGSSLLLTRIPFPNDESTDLLFHFPRNQEPMYASTVERDLPARRLFKRMRRITTWVSFLLICDCDVADSAITGIVPLS